MPSELPDGLIFTDCPEREDSRDVLITPHHIKSLDELPNGAKIGTGSKRRTYQLLKYRNDFQIEGIRGNVDTRIKKMMEQGLDGIILAAAGIHRLGMKSCREYQIIPLSKAVILPAPAQGILAIEVKKERNDLRKMFQVMSDPIATIQSKVERKFLDSVDGSCHIPIGADCRMKEEEIILDGLLGSEDGKILCRKEVKGKIGEKEQLAEQLAKQLIEVVYGDQ
jgi:hydroxymethylbilane synthase